MRPLDDNETPPLFHPANIGAQAGIRLGEGAGRCPLGPPILSAGMPPTRRSS
jgi:hypothetical protein